MQLAALTAILLRIGAWIYRQGGGDAALAAVLGLPASASARLARDS
jgi:hypothetical protein